MRIAICVLASLSISAHRGACQQIEFQSPDDVARAVLRADSLRDWRSLLALAHPIAIADFKRFELMRLGDNVRSRSMLSMDSCMQAQLSRLARITLDSVYRVSSAEELAQLSPDTVFTRYHLWYARFAPTAEMDSVMARPVRSYVGHVLANDSTAYGVLLETYNRLPFPDWPAEQSHIMTFRRFGSGWRSMLDPDFAHATSVTMFEGCNDR